MSFFHRLFTFRQRDTRTPLEDFLTELLAEWLRQATVAGKIEHVLGSLFKQPPEGLPDAAGCASLVWETQHVIGPGHRGEGKRPDLVGRGEGFLFIIENKIAAGFTRHSDDDGEIDQLNLYDTYLRERNEPRGGIVLLTQYTLPPDGWDQRTLYWSAVEKYMRDFLANDGGTTGSTLHYITRQLMLFLGEHGMNGTRIALEDITVYPAYQRLMQGLSNLGRIASNRLSIELPAAGLQVLKAPRGGSNGEFVWPHFHGGILSNGGIRCYDAQFILWSGVVAGEVYEHLKPATEGIPDLSVGFGLWVWDQAQAGEEILKEVLAALNKRTPTPWTLEPHPREKYGPIYLISARRSLVDLHVQANGGDLDDSAADFFEIHCRALTAVLSHTLSDGNSRESCLLKLAQASAEPASTVEVDQAPA
ncbi:hypothetical protein V0R50_30100 [Pseudomonas sp. 148P]|uniref:PD-(D/E)XK nuclease superfamily protein n=1 Tax=Pseudomonas ulcerans TaxID=3115852 RepID=A0ABU7I100_9PSED|nr:MULTISPECIES: hypothetical protein [unclassified Pseudomonas]MEE1923357.1 hypothetical protein [Pseudomonas sp. 147P]MEE1937500.1 hypothetical protein [Pseudomonas sp. 148P]